MLGFTRRQLFHNFLIWSIVAVFTATQLYIKMIQENGVGDWWALFNVQLGVWWIWGLITPLVFWLGNRFRVDQTRWWQIVLIHVPIAVLIVCIYLGLYAVIWNVASQGILTVAGFWAVWKLLFPNLFHWHFFIYMAIVGIVHARSYYRESQELALKGVHLEKQLLQSQLNFLKMQMQPHFLFNTLNSIVSSIRQGKTDEAAHMTTELSALLRASLSGTDRQIITLKEELFHVRSYLNIEKFRFKDLEVTYNIPDDLLYAEVPHFFLQPIVENAIKHGISQKVNARHIALTAERDDHLVRFKIDNEGPPIDVLRNGIGLSNAKQRLRALFGDEGNLHIYPNEQGTTVEIEIPFS